MIRDANRTLFLASNLQDTLWRWTLLTCGTLITWFLLSNLLEVNVGPVNYSAVNTSLSQPTAILPPPPPMNQSIQENVDLTPETNFISQTNEITTPIASPLPAMANPTVTATKPEPVVSATTKNIAKETIKKIAAVPATTPSVKTITVKPGDTLSKLFKRNHITAQAYKAIEVLPLFYNNSHKLIAGQKLQFTQSNANELTQLIYPLSQGRQLQINKTKQGYTSILIDHDYTEQAVLHHNMIHGSISEAAHKAGLSTPLAAQLASLMETDAKDYNGGSLSVIYDELYKKGKPIKSKEILAAQIKLGNKKFEIFRNVDPSGQISYYTENGSSLKPSFLRAPLHYDHISSGFSLHRLHPILHFVRPHLGVDFAAPRGTPVYASSDGTIEFMGRMGGYGNLIILKTNNTYSTRYGHLQRFASNVRIGSHVKESNVIGYVGETGLASGSHLHYEFRIDGKPVDPLTVELPHASPISRSQRREFLAYAKAESAKF